MQVRQIQSRLNLAGRYATALYLETKETDQVTKISHDITQFEELLDMQPELATLIKSQIVRPEVVIAIFTDITKLCHLSETFLNFLGVITHNRRLRLLPKIFTAFQSIVDQASNIVQVKIEVAKITPEHKIAIEQLLASKYPSQKLQHTYVTKPELIGGFRAFIHQYCLDYSLLSRLNRLRYLLKEAQS